MIRFHHVILLLAEKTMLRREKTGELARKKLLDELTAMPKMTVRGGLITEKCQFSALKRRRRGGHEIFNTR